MKLTLYPLKWPRIESSDTGSQARRAVVASRRSIRDKFLGASVGTVVSREYINNTQ